jgi:hypothetical protein
MLSQDRDAINACLSETNFRGTGGANQATMG